MKFWNTFRLCQPISRKKSIIPSFLLLNLTIKWVTTSKLLFRFREETNVYLPVWFRVLGKKLIEKSKCSPGHKLFMKFYLWKKIMNRWLVAILFDFSRPISFFSPWQSKSWFAISICLWDVNQIDRNFHFDFMTKTKWV